MAFGDRDPVKQREWEQRSRDRARRRQREKPAKPRGRRKGVPRDWTPVVFRLYGNKCVVTKKRAVHAHHVIGAQRLERDGRIDLIGDHRLGVPVTFDAHMAHENASRRIKRAELPAGVVAAAYELGYGWYIERFYP